MVYSDFPESWPNLLDVIMSHLTSNVRQQQQGLVSLAVHLQMSRTGSSRQAAVGACSLAPVYYGWA